MKRDEILDFIRQFADAKDLFLNGMCYWFAHILHHRFEGSSIWYDDLGNHFVCKIGDTFYDVTGEVSQWAYVPWEIFRQLDEIHTARIERDCINKMI